MKNWELVAASLKKAMTLSFIIFSVLVTSAQTSRQVTHQTQAWFSVNSTAHLSSKWALLFDAHIRCNQFLDQNNFKLLRAGVLYNIDNTISVAGGYAHEWLYPSTTGWHTISNENRVYQQLMMLSKFKKVSITQRIRNEQRWQQKITNDKFTGSYKFTDRIRYLLSINIPVFKNDRLPELNLSDEILLQTGKEIVNNTFDQNRFFVGIKERISKALSFDTGYMYIYQQKSTGYQYEQDNTFRLFFYYTPFLSKKHKA
jgi:hypothetical protein